ncbi:MAG TPA: hypothetical protein VLT79_05635 [Gemmatimonadales bacterium]|nr:hypothetical protein [Gemmatimonadales bacterium]
MQTSRFAATNAKPRWWVPVLAIALAWGAALVAPRCAPDDTDMDAEVTEPPPAPPHHLQRAAPPHGTESRVILQRG